MTDTPPQRRRTVRQRSRAAFTASTTLAAFRVAGFPALWSSGTLGGLASAATAVSVAWVTLEVADSPLAVGATLAIGLVPSLVLGIPLGGLVDRLDRRRALIVANLGAAALVAVAAAAPPGALTVPALLAVSLLVGVAQTLRGAAWQAAAFDLAGPAGITNALALGNFGGFLLGTVGSVAGGVVLERGGGGAGFAVAAVAFALGALVLLPTTGVRRPRDTATAPPSPRESLTLMLRNRAVGLIALIVIVTEVFGFSAQTLFPTYARDVLHLDASALGSLVGARYVGAMAGLLVLARIGLGDRAGLAVALTTLLIALGLVGFALSTVFVLSLALIALYGAACAALDSEVQAILQRVVEDRERGASAGVWFFGIGFGPVGHLGLGAAASVVAAPVALAVSGGVLGAFAVLLMARGATRRIG